MLHNPTALFWPIWQPDEHMNLNFFPVGFDMPAGVFLGALARGQMKVRYLSHASSALNDVVVLVPSAFFAITS